MDDFWSDSDADPCATDDEDDEYVPDAEAPISEDEYCSDDSEIDFLEHKERENMIIEPDFSLLSKDKSIEYSKEPLPRSRPSNAANHAERNKGNHL